jgi:hypothetical protein
MRIFLECGCCGQFHEESFTGDCRDDAHRYSDEAIMFISEHETIKVIDLEEQMAEIESK